MKPTNYIFAFGMICLTILAACGKTTINNCDTACELHGSCNPINNTCDCDAGYEGVNCTTETRARFIGNYAVRQDSNGVIKNYTCIIANGSGMSNSISIAALNNASFQATVATNNSISISDFNADFIQITGAGNLSGNTINLNITFKPNFAPAYTLAFTLTK